MCDRACHCLLSCANISVLLFLLALQEWNLIDLGQLDEVLLEELERGLLVEIPEVRSVLY